MRTLTVFECIQGTCIVPIIIESFKIYLCDKHEANLILPFIVICMAHHIVAHWSLHLLCWLFGGCKICCQLSVILRNRKSQQISLFYWWTIDDVMCVYSNSQLNSDNAAVYDTVIFAGPPPMKQRLWPRHCVQDTWGSELHKDLKVRGDSLWYKLDFSCCICKSAFFLNNEN